MEFISEIMDWIEREEKYRSCVEECKKDEIKREAV